MSLKFAVAGLLVLAVTDVALAGEEKVANTSGPDAVIKRAELGRCNDASASATACSSPGDEETRVKPLAYRCPGL